MTPLCALLLTGAALEAAGQGLFTCTRPDGRTVYQDAKCDDDAKQKVIEAAKGASPSGDCPTVLYPTPARDPVTGLETEARRKERMEVEMVAEVFTAYDTCAAEVAGFTQRFGAAYREWQRKFGSAIATYGRHPTARRKVECAREFEAQRSRQHGADVQGKTGYCMRMLGPVLEKLNAEGMRP